MYDEKRLFICFFVIYFFNEMNVKVFGPYFNQIVYFLIVEW